ncbi:MAG: DUF1206 domain-containing protein [Polyangiales bacterium]
MRPDIALPNVSPRAVKQLGSRGTTIAARLGYLTHGLVYAMIGVLAVLAAVGQGGGVTSREGAVQRIGETAFGTVLLWAVAIGLACYALWNVVRVVLDPENVGRDGKGALRRFGYGVSAVSHGLLAIHTFQLAYGAATSGGGKTRTIAEVFNLPFGRVLIGLIGLGVIAFGISEIYRAWTGAVAKEFDGASLPVKRQWIVNIARIGHGARGVVFAISGSSFVVAALNARASETHGVDDSLRQLASQPFGSVLLGLVAAGLVAYGVDMFLLARYARIPEV